VNEPSARLAFLIEYLDLPAATGEPDAQWEAFQLEHLNNSSLLDIDAKARQAGWSFIAAAEAVAEGVLIPRSTNIFVSINQDEAAEKVRYAKQVIESLDEDVRPKLIIDNKLELELANGSRMISHPCRPVRGKARANIYLDEFAHYPKDREIYAAALPVTTRGGRLRIGSTPLGAGGQFWEIFEQKIQPYPGYRRRRIPWWHVAALCKDVPNARKLAPAMLTEERVRTFGKPRLVEIFENLPLEDFQQEYECAWVDEATAWITWDEIKRNQVNAQAGNLWHRQARGVNASLDAIDEVAQACQDRTIEGVLAGGMDVGRHKHLTEITFVGKSTTGHLPYRLGISLAGVEFDDQKAVASKALDVLPVTKFLIDQNGLGMQLAEQLNQVHGERAEGVNFTNETKELWSVELKVQVQRGRVPIPLDRDLSYQIHSIKKKTTAAKNAVFDTQGNERHHADKYWALALAVWAASPGQKAQVGMSSARVVGRGEMFG
jgi:phage FluMu gp28-like protein